jgi:hypothetical protein
MIFTCIIRNLLSIVNLVSIIFIRNAVRMIARICLN